MADYPKYGPNARRMRPPAAARPVQGRAADQDAPALATKYSCSTHYVTYYMPNGERALCPACDAEKQTSDLREALKESQNRAERLHEENRKLRLQTDVVESIKDALDVTGHDDLMFLKEVLYRWKIDRSIALKVTHGTSLGSKKKKRDAQAPNGFIAMPRGGEPEGYACSSLGGLAIAEYFEEALNTVGSAQAMILLVRAMAKQLPGATG